MSEKCGPHFELLTALIQSEYSLKSMMTPNFCYGGEAFQVQPTVAVIDSSGDIALNFIGRAQAFIGTGPSP